MNKEARERIFSRLYAADRQPVIDGPQVSDLAAKNYSPQEKIETLTRLMKAMRTEVHLTDSAKWLDTLEEILKNRGVKTLLYGPRTEIGSALQQRRRQTGSRLPELVAFDREVEQIKETVFSVDAGITATYGAVADIGALILWSSAEEPRQISLVPPIHVSVLLADNIYSTLLEVMQKENWAGGMPTNAFLISGPSKTADIELTLAFGVHGPKELIVLIVDGKLAEGIEAEANSKEKNGKGELHRSRGHKL